MRGIALALVGLISSASAFSIVDQVAQLPWKKPNHPHKPDPHDPHHGHGSHGPPKPKAGPYETLIEHFDQHRTGTDIYLQDHFTKMYHNSSIVVTQDPRFQLLAFASGQSETPVLVKRDEEIEAITRANFRPPMRRRDGQGVLLESTVFAGYKVAYNDEEMLAIVATYSEGYSIVTQWHLIGTSKKTAYELIHACSNWASSIHDAVLVFDQSYWQVDYKLYEAIQKASWDDVVLEEKFKKSIQNDYRSFFKSEETYKRLQVPWKRGLIFMGPPGNGKTISLKAIMKEVKVPLLYVKSFHTYAGDEYGIRQIFQRARTEAPCVLILEDLDSLINSGNRAFFLNEVDGLEDNDGLLLIGTTNHFDRLDPALSSRPSRFDRKYNFPNPTEGERRDYAVYWQTKLNGTEGIDFPDELLDEFAGKTDKFSFAYMKEAFIASLLIIAGQDPSTPPDFPGLLMDQVDKLRKQLDEEEVALQAALEAGEGLEAFGRVSMSSSGVRGGPDAMFQDDEMVRYRMGAHSEPIEL